MIVTVLQAADRDQHGNRGPDTTATIDVLAIAPRRSEDRTPRATDEAIEELTIYTNDPDVAVRAVDRIRLDDDRVFDVDGEPERWATNPLTATQGGAVIQISRVVS